MKNLFVGVTLIIFLFTCVNCGPVKVEQFEEIEANETAFLVPLEGASLSGQKKFMSIDYLNSPEVKVATKRVSLPLREKKLGRGGWNFKWIPTMRVIKVVRTPVTREWTGDEKTGSSTKNEALWVESQDSIGFGVGVNITAMITEDDAAKFLYYFAGKPLADVVDENVRGKVNSVLSREFANYELEQGRKKKNDIFKIASTETINDFAKMGVTITNLGLAEGLVYEDNEIQTAINDKFRAEMDIQIQAQKNLAQVEINARNVAIAKADADAKVKEAEGMIAIETAKAEAAKKFATSIDARRAMVNLEIERMNAEARLTFAKKIQPGVLPNNILPEGSGLMFGLDSNFMK